MQKDLISIIIPVYNLESLIGRTLESILKQTYKNIEIIVVNDGSTDDSSIVIESYVKKDSRIILFNKENEGVSVARLYGVKQSHGKWISFVDGDDLVEPDMYEFLLNNALKYDVEISHCGIKRVFPNGKIINFYDTGRLVEQDRITGMKDLLEGSFIEPGLWNKLFHKTLFHSLLHEDIMDKSIKINEDLLMNFYLFQNAKKSIYVDRCKYVYMVRDGSSSRIDLNKNKIYDPIKVKKIIITHCHKNEKSIAEKAYINTCINTYNTLIIQKDSAYRSDEKTVRQLIIENKSFCKLLNKQKQISILFIIYMPFIYKLLYCFYEKFFQKKLY